MPPIYHFMTKFSSSLFIENLFLPLNSPVIIIHRQREVTYLSPSSSKSSLSRTLSYLENSLLLLLVSTCSFPLLRCAIDQSEQMDTRRRVVIDRRGIYLLAPSSTSWWWWRWVDGPPLDLPKTTIYFVWRRCEVVKRFVCNSEAVFKFFCSSWLKSYFKEGLGHKRRPRVSFLILCCVRDDKPLGTGMEYVSFIRQITILTGLFLIYFINRRC